MPGRIVPGRATTSLDRIRVFRGLPLAPHERGPRGSRRTTDGGYVTAEPIRAGTILATGSRQLDLTNVGLGQASESKQRGNQAGRAD